MNKNQLKLGINSSHSFLVKTGFGTMHNSTSKHTDTGHILALYSYCINCYSCDSLKSSFQESATLGDSPTTRSSSFLVVSSSCGIKLQWIVCDTGFSS